MDFKRASLCLCSLLEYIKGVERKIKQFLDIKSFQFSVVDGFFMIF